MANNREEFELEEDFEADADEGEWEEPPRVEAEDDEGEWEEPLPATSSNVPHPPRPRPTQGAATSSKAAAASAKAKPKEGSYNKGGLNARQRREKLRLYQQMKNQARRAYGLPIDEDVPLQQQLNYERMMKDTEILRQRSMINAHEEAVQYRVARHMYSEALVKQAHEIMSQPLPFTPRSPEEAAAAYAAQQHLAWQLPFNMIQPPRPLWIQAQGPPKVKPLVPNPKGSMPPPEPAFPPKAKAASAPMHPPPGLAAVRPEVPKATMSAMASPPSTGLRGPAPAMASPPAVPAVQLKSNGPPPYLTGFLSKPGVGYPLPGPLPGTVVPTLQHRPPMHPPPLQQQRTAPHPLSCQPVAPVVGS